MAVIPTNNVKKAVVPSPTSVQGVINKAPTAGYTGVQNQGMYRMEVGGKTVDTGNSNTLANLLKQGGKIISSPGQQQSAFDPNAYAKQYQDQINNMYNQQKESQLAQFRAQRDQAVGQINQQKAQVAPQYQGMRNQADVVNTQQVQKLREMMAANGLQASGENVTASVGLSNQRQANLNELNLQEQQTVNDYNRRIADMMNPAEENAVIAALEAERARALLDMGMRADEIGYARNRDSIMDGRYADETAYSRGRDSIEDSRYADERDYGRSRDTIMDNRYADETKYSRGRDTIEDNRYAKEQELEEYWRQKQWNEMPPAEKAAILFRESLQNSGGGSGGSKRSSGGSSSKSKSKTSSSKTTPTSSLVQQFKAEKAAASKTPLDQYYESQVLRSPKNYLQDIFQPVAPRDNKNLSPWELMKMMGG